MTHLAYPESDLPVPDAVIELGADMTLAARNRMALQDVREGLRLSRLSLVLGWLDIRLRYRGSVLGPLWLTLSTAIMVVSLGWLYAAISAAFGLRFLWLNAKLVRDPSRAWAKRNFLFSMQYLAGVFLAVVVDKHVPLSVFGV